MSKTSLYALYSYSRSDRERVHIYLVSTEAGDNLCDEGRDDHQHPEGYQRHANDLPKPVVSIAVKLAPSKLDRERGRGGLYDRTQCRCNSQT